MKKVIIFICIIISMAASAQNDMLQLEGNVTDFKTHTEVMGATVELLNKDSSVVYRTIAKTEGSVGDQTYVTSSFTLNAPRTTDASYIIKVSMVGYKTLYTNFNVGRVSKSTIRKRLPNLLLHEDSKTLKEVVVSSTKVKFYHRGDTVVYNADAFVLSEGSMLESLVRQMPGMEIKSNGDIYHNGRLVEELLLNGKAMFSKDKSVLMENLPTYTVKQVEIYDRQTDKAKFLGDDSPEGKRYAMDVKLKKEYSIGWMANVEAGSGFAKSGHDTPYMGRLFAMRFSDHSRMVFYANANNLNDKRKPGQDDSWKPSDIKEGTLTEQLAGLDYDIDSRNKKWEISGETKFSHSILDNQRTQNRTNFLTAGDTYEQETSTERNKNLSLYTYHRIELKPKDVIRIDFTPEFSYSKYDFNSSTQSMAWADTTINRYRKAGLQRGHDTKANFNVYMMYKSYEKGGYIDFSASVKYSDHHDDTFKQYALWYGNAAQPSSTADQYFKNRPDHSTTVDGFITYAKKRLAKGLTLDLRYYIRHTATTRDSYLYLLEQADCYEQGQLGVLPSINEYAATIDKRNSYETEKHETDNSIMPVFIWRNETNGHRWYGQLQIPVNFKTRKLEYHRGVVDTTTTRSNALFGLADCPCFAMMQYRDKTQSHKIELSVTPSVPDLLYTVNMYDDTDPLNIHEGNARLKTSYEYMAQYSFSNWRNWKFIEYAGEVQYTKIDNAISMGYIYDKQTGVKTYKTYNVNGNWATHGTFNLTLRNKKQTLIMKSGTTVLHRQSADYTGQDGVAQRSIVRTENINQELRLTYMKANQSVSLNASADYRYIHSNRDDFSNLNVWDFQYGLSAVLNLPWQVQLSTDLTMYSRRGYSESTLNTNDLVWNARMSKSLMKGKLVIMLDGFDILGNLSSVSYNLNAQGRTEIRRNVLPQYAMLHLQYKLNLKPKKKS